MWPKAKIMTHMKTRAQSQQTINSTRIGLKNQRGSVAVEFGLLLPVLAVMLFGIVDFGRMLWFKEVLVNATRDGARYGTLFDQKHYQPEIQTFVTTALVNGGVAPTNLTVTAPAAVAGAVTGTAITVTSTMDWNYLVIDKILPAAFVPATQLTASVTMMKE